MRRNLPTPCPVLLPLLLLVAAGACDRTPDPATPIEPAFAKGGRPVDTDARAVFEIHEFTGVPLQSGSFAGDGLAADGSSSGGPISTYDDGQCGVSAKVYQSGSGDAVMSLSATTGGCNGRVAVIDLGSPSGSVASGIARADFVNVRCVMQAVPGEPASACPYPSEADASDPTVGYRNFAVEVDNAQCGLLRWDNEDPIDTPQTNLPTKVTYMGRDALGRRYWIAESLPPHHAGCIRTVKGKPGWDGVTRVIPFRIVVFEKS